MIDCSRSRVRVLWLDLLIVLFGLALSSSVLAQAALPRLPTSVPKFGSGSPTATLSKRVPRKEQPEEEEPKPPKPSQEATLQPFGANLFIGNFLHSREDGLNPEYTILPGDHVALNVWGALQINSVFVVDGQGNIFIPEVGPIHLAGVRNAQLTDVVKAGMSRVYTRYFEVYTNLITAKPVAVYVTGGVARPGRYAGTPSDSALFFLDQAGGIDANLGSYRDIDILRGGKSLATVDLYDFILNGTIPSVQFQDEDTILVRKRGPVIELQGSVSAPSLLEFKTDSLPGAEALEVVPGAARATEVTVTGIRNGVPISQTLNIKGFKGFQLRNGDSILLRDDGRPGTILVKVEGETESNSVIALKRGARLVDVLRHVPVKRGLANVAGVHIRRPSVAAAQKDAIDDSLFRLERSALLALSGSANETDIRVKEADLVERFAEQARLIQPLGRVVTAVGDRQINLLLEDGDVIVIPPKTNVVRVSGEVFLTQAVMYRPGTSAEDYINQAGGYTERADDSRVIVHHPNAQVQVGDPSMTILPGDEILVPPKVDSKITQNILDITQIVYQVAVSAAVVILLLP